MSRHTVSTSEYETELGVSNRTALNHLTQFVEMGLMKRIGTGPATKYEVIR